MELQGKRATIVGMGRSARAAARLLLREGAAPFVSDAADGPGLDEARGALEALGVPYETGGHSDAAFGAADLIVLSPGVPADLAPIAAARRRGVPVIAELELGYRFCDAKILAVTGTNGKTTTTELLRAMVSACGHTVGLAGNNATALSAAVLEPSPPAYMVLEVSSYQLDAADAFRPWIAGVPNLTPDHLARHGSMVRYAAAKERLFARQGAGDTAVVNADDPWVRAMRPGRGASLRRFSLALPLDDGLWIDGEVIRDGDAAVAQLGDNPLPGRHNLENVLLALTMMRAGGFDWARALEGLRGFRGVEHRIEHVLSACGVDVYNDSKSTNVDSLRVALESFSRPLVLIAGGRGKGSDYRALRGLVSRHVRHLVTMGEDAPLLEAALGDVTACARASGMADAVRRAYAASRPGDAILLSPACASFDMYRNFEERGADFKHWARALQPGAGAAV